MSFFNGFPRRSSLIRGSRPGSPALEKESKSPAAQANTAVSGRIRDSAHVGDIQGALGSIGRHETPHGSSRFQRLRFLLAVMGPGLIVMVGDNDAGGVATYAQAGQNYGMALLWTLVFLIPVLYVNQEMVVRLGAVAGVGHARLIFARFGKFWGAFSVGDLIVVNALTIVTEFIGVAFALGYFGLPKTVAVPLAVILLFTVVAGGSFRRWERMVFVLIAVNVVMFPLVLLVDPKASEVVQGLAPSFPRGLDSTLLMLIVAVVGTTVAPWQLFFQQSNVVDKRLTPRWIRYERIDLRIGIGVVMLGATAIMSVAAFGLAGTDAVGNFTDAGAVAHALRDNVSPTAGALFAILLLDASLIGANAVGLATTYALGDTFRRRHSLHWKITEAPAFYLGYGLLLVIAAAVAFSPDAVLGLLTLGVQALAGVLLPSATVFLVLLCNDNEVLGPWVNTNRQNVVAGAIVWILVLLSLALTAATIFPDLSTATLEVGFGIGGLVGITGGAALYRNNRISRCRERRRQLARVEADYVGIDPGDIDEVAALPRSRADRRAVLEQARQTWRTPALDTLHRPPFTPLRLAGMIALRGYLVLAIALVAIKVAQLILT